VLRSAFLAARLSGGLGDSVGVLGGGRRSRQVLWCCGGFGGLGLAFLAFVVSLGWWCWRVGVRLLLSVRRCGCWCLGLSALSLLRAR